MSQIDQITLAIQGLLVAGTIVRVIICLMKISFNPDQKEQIIPKIKNALGFMILGVSVFSIKDLILYYF